MNEQSEQSFELSPTQPYPPHAWTEPAQVIVVTPSVVITPQHSSLITNTIMTSPRADA